MSKSRGRENMKKLSGVLEGLGSQVKQHQWRLAHRSTARWDQCALVCRLMSVHTFTCMWNNGFSSCLPSSPSPLISLSFPLFFSYMYPPLPPLPPSLPSPASSLLSPVLAFLLLSISSPFLFFSHLLFPSLLLSTHTQHHSAEVLKWEESKRWQKRLEGLRTKLTEKNRELEAAQRQIKALKETLARCVS